MKEAVESRWKGGADKREDFVPFSQGRQEGNGETKKKKTVQV
jgi:hypothetical protein